MAIQTFRRVRSKDKDITNLVDSAGEVLDTISAKALLDGVLIKDVSITVGTQKSVNHTLGRELQGWFITRQTADCNFWDSQDSNTVPTRTLLIESAHASTTTVTIDLWVF